MRIRLIISIFLIVLIHSNCQKPDMDLEERLVGTWAPHETRVEILVTTSQDVSFPLFKPRAIGSIAISGAEEGELVYLNPPNDGTGWRRLYPEEIPINVYPKYNAVFQTFPSPRMGVYFYGSDSISVGYRGYSSYPAPVYDGSTFTLICDSLRLYSTYSNPIEMILVNGSLQSETILIESNTPTHIVTEEERGEGHFYDQILRFDDDGDWLGDFDNGIAYTGSWSLIDSELHIDSKYIPSESRICEIDGNTLTLTEIDTLSYLNSFPSYYNWISDTVGVSEYIRTGISVFKRIED